MTGFAIGAAIAVIIVLLLVLRPLLWRRPQAATASHLQLNAAIYRDQFTELDRDRKEGVLSEEDYQQARMEMQRRVLEDGRDDDVMIMTQAPKKTMVGVALFLPLAAVALYVVLGNPAGLNAASAGGQHAVTSADIERMVGTLAAKLEKEPKNYEGWAMLARSYKAMQKPVEAQQAFEHAWPLVETNAQLLADYADLLAATAGGRFDGRPIKLIEKALKLDPNNGQALWLAGSAAFDAGRFDQAIEQWGHLLKLLPPGSDDARMIESNIAEASAKAGKPVVASTKPAPAASGGGTLRGHVEIAAAVKDKAAGSDVVMVVAREAGGPRMPVAVLRVRVADLPLDFTLDDSMSVMPERSLSAVKEVEVEARVSKTGMAMPEAGDLLSATLKAPVGASGLQLRIDHVRP